MKNTHINLSLKYLVDNEMFIVCPLLIVKDFIAFCDQRGVQTSVHELERLEKLGIMWPLACARKQWVADEEDEQLNQAEGNRRPDHDRGGDGGGWYRSLHFQNVAEVARLLEAGEVWDPADRSFEPWHDHTLNPHGDWTIDRFYSPFQCYALSAMVSRQLSLLRRLSYEWACADESERDRLISTMPRIMADQVVHGRAIADRAAPVWQLCQAISNRYYPHTQCDRRVYTVPMTREAWHELTVAWHPSQVLTDLGLTVDDVFELCDWVDTSVQLSDPLKNWHALLSFIDPQMKRQLRGPALLGQMMREMEEMIRLFYNAVTGREVRPTWDREGSLDAAFGEGTEKDDLTLLDYLTNQYHLNPRPRLILAVEGTGEYEQFQRLCRSRHGFPLGEASIEIVDLHGYPNFEGPKTDRLSAWSRLIDYHHHHNTIVFVVLDLHGRAKELRRNLAKARSLHDQDRCITKEGYFHIWNNSVEFDSFSDEEVARALTEVFGSRVEFHADEVAVRRELNQKSKKDELSDLYGEAFSGGYKLDKPLLLEILVGYAIDDPRDPWAVQQGKDEPRQIVQVLRRVVKLASKNHPPPGARFRTMNVTSGIFGDVIASSR